MRRRISLWIRLGVSAALILLLLSRLDWRDMWGFLRRADILLVAVTLGAVLVDRGLMAGRWLYLLEALDVHAPRRKLVKIFFLSTFFGSFLPTGIGGEAVRAISLSRLTAKGVEAVTSVVMDRLFGFFSMLLTGLASLVISYRVYSHPALLTTVLVFSVATALAFAVILSSSVHTWLATRFPSGQEGWRGVVHRAADALSGYRKRPGLLVLVLVMSVGVQILRVFQAYLLSEAMDLNTPLLYFFCFVPPILIITMLPISVSGLGTTNLAYVALFSQVGMDADGAFVLSVLILALGVVGNLPGGVIYAIEGFSASESGEGAHSKNDPIDRADLVESGR